MHSLNNVSTIIKHPSNVLCINCTRKVWVAVMFSITRRRANSLKMTKRNKIKHTVPYIPYNIRERKFGVHVRTPAHQRGNEANWWVRYSGIPHVWIHFSKLVKTTFLYNKTKFLLKLFRKRNNENRHPEFHLFQFKWNRNHSIQSRP